MATTKTANEEIKQARAIQKLELELEMIETQEHLWKLRAKAKRLRKAEVQRQLAEVKR